jgi:hypothetical protein
MIPIALAALAPLAQTATGLVQSNRAKKILEGLNTPTYDIPKAQTESLNIARTLASTNQLPNQVQAEQALDQSTANALYNVNQNAQSGTEALAALSGVYGNQMGAQNQLAGQAANFVQGQKQNYMNELAKYAAYQDKAFDYNVNQPFQRKMAEAQGLAGAGMNNKYQGFKSITGIAANALLGGLLNGGGNNQAPTSENPTVDALKNVLGNMGTEADASTFTGSGENMTTTPSQDTFMQDMNNVVDANRGIFNAPITEFNGMQLTPDQMAMLQGVFKLNR